jgi:DNA repair photolyase
MIYAKEFDERRFQDELRRIPRKQSIAIGTATDPYQPAERRYGITRRILEVLAKERGRSISMVTKSDLVARDAEILAGIARANILHVNLTITTVDEDLARLLEPYAPRPTLRLDAIASLTDAGVSTGVLPNPIMPLITDSEENLHAVAAASARAGANSFGSGVLFLKACSREVFLQFVDAHFPRFGRAYREEYSRGAFLKGPYVERIKERVAAIRTRHGLDRDGSDYRPELWIGEPQLELFSTAEE